MVCLGCTVHPHTPYGARNHVSQENRGGSFEHETYAYATLALPHGYIKYNTYSSLSQS